MKQHDLVSAVRNRLKQPLPGEKAHLKMLPFERRPAMKYIEGTPSPRASSVLILLYPLDDYFGTILIKRTEDLSVHSGQVSFPGGKQDPGDISPVHTALREAEEEIGIEPGKVQIMGALSPLYVSPSNFEITPVVGYIAETGVLRPNPAEVERIIELSLKNIETLRANNDISVRGFLLQQVPGFSVNGHIVWGATAMILQELVEILNEA